MNPTMAALVVLGAGAFVVWYTTRPGAGGIGSLFGGGGLTGEPVTTTEPPFTDAQLNYYLSGFATHLTGAQAASTGASAGAPFAGVTFGISVGVGALAGWLSVRNSNDTREDREVFAKRLGFTGANDDGLGIHTQQTTSIDDKSKGLYSYLTFINRDDLRHTAMAVIGRKDFEGNVAWMVSVLGALYVAGFKFPR